MNMPKVASYGNYKSSNYGAHSLVFAFPNGVEIFFSYETVVAFYSNKTGLVCSKNVWGKTTGKHLNWIEDDKKKRVDYTDFEKKLKDMLDGYNLNTREEYP